METIMVITGDQNLPTGSFTTSGTSINLASGQLGVLSWDRNSSTKALGNYIVSTDDSNDVQAIKLVQGTPASANTQLADIWEVGDKTHLESGIIRKGNIRSVYVKKARIPVFGGAAGTSFPTPANNNEYQLFVKLDSVHYDREYSTLNDNVISATAPIVNFTTLGTSNPLDYVLTHVITNLNSQSKAVSSKTRKGTKSFVAFGVRTSGAAGVTAPTAPTIVLTSGAITSVTGGTGGSGYTTAPTVTLSGGSPSVAGSITATINAAGAITGYTIVTAGSGYGSAPTAALSGGAGLAIGTITPTTNITFQTVDGTAQVLKSSSELCQTLARLVKDNADLIATSTIENIDVSTAGASAKINAIIVIGLPHEKAAYYDDIAQVQVKPSLNFAKSFITGVDPVVTVCHPDEGTGQGRVWNLLNRTRPQLQVHTMQNHPHGDWFSEGKNYIKEDNLYTSYIIDYFDTETVLSTDFVSPKKATLLFRCEVPSSFTTTVNNIIARSGTDIPTVTSNDAGAGTTSANTVADVEAVLSAWLEHARTTGTNFAVGGDAVAGGTYLS